MSSLTPDQAHEENLIGKPPVIEVVNEIAEMFRMIRRLPDGGDLPFVADDFFCEWMQTNAEIMEAVQSMNRVLKRKLGEDL